MIYHQTMTPLWLNNINHACYIGGNCTFKPLQLEFSAGAVKNAALLKVPMIPPGALDDLTPMTVEITVSNDVSYGGHHAGYVDSDINFGISDGNSFVGFQAMDKGNYNEGNRRYSPCFEAEGVSGKVLTSLQYGPKFSETIKETFYPGKFVFTFKLPEGWGSCQTAQDGGFTRTASFNGRLRPARGLFLEVYKTDANESVAIKFISVVVTRDESK